MVVTDPSESFLARNGLLKAIRAMKPKYSTSSMTVRTAEIDRFCPERALKSGSSRCRAPSFRSCSLPVAWNGRDAGPAGLTHDEANPRTSAILARKGNCHSRKSEEYPR